MKINSVFSKALAVATVVATSIGFQSCLDDDDNNAYYLRYPNADRKSTRLNSSHAT